MPGSVCRACISFKMFVGSRLAASRVFPAEVNSPPSGKGSVGVFA